MNCVVTNGENYLARKLGNQWVPVKELGEATVLTKESAQNFMRVFPNKFKGQGYKFVELDTVIGKKELPDDFFKEKEDEELSYDTRGFKATIQSERVEELKQQLRDVNDLMQSFTHTYEKACKDLNYINLEIIDIEHAIELRPGNAVRRCYLEGELMRARQRRRECKDIKAILSSVMRFTYNDWNDENLQEVLGRTEDRYYVPRVRPDLFE
mgnify:CR=1 FL=1